MKMKMKMKTILRILKILKTLSIAEKKNLKTN